MRYEHKGGAIPTTLTAEIAADALTIPIAASDGWPDGAVGPFWAVINRNTLTEEKVLLSGRSGLFLQVLSDAGGTGRAKDGTVAHIHPVNSTIEHIWTATEADEANAHIMNTTAAHGVTFASLATDAEVAAAILVETDNRIAADALKADLAMGHNWQGGNYTFAKTDAPLIVILNAAGPSTFTIPAEATIGTWPDNTQLQFLNGNVGVLTIAAAAGVTLYGSPTTFAMNKGGMLVRLTSNAWTLIPFSGGVEWADFSDTPTGTYTDADGITWKYKRYTSNGSLTITRAGLVDVLVIGGGSASVGGDASWLSSAGGMAVGLHRAPAATHTVTIGAGGTYNVAFTNPSQFSGTKSTIGSWVGGNGGICGNNVGAGEAFGGAAGSGYTSSITGTAVVYGVASGGGGANNGNGSTGGINSNGAAGVAIVRVPV